jgi:OPA family glycerol-3-phosphate transporter-like MFS transporter/OPA family sugar phosphate sensor protein UhpC-like MFS transporter
MKDERSFRIAQNKFIVYSAIVYAFFYLTRKNLSMAMPGMMEEGVISTYAVGTMLSLHGILYGLSRFVNGFWADRLNGRVFMTIGLALSAVMNFCFGCTTLSVLFAVFWIVNGWTQGMGFPPCAKMLTHWIHPKELATKMSIWNTSHSFGAVMALGLCSLLLGLGYGWRWCFYVPAVMAGLVAVFCFFKVKETPAEAGVEELEIEGAAATDKGGSSVTTKDRMRLVFCNKVIWMVALSNFFVYIVRFGFLDWGPTFLKQFKGIPVSKGGLMIIAFEVAAIVGTIFAGWATDKWFKGRGVRTCVFCMLLTALCAFGFWFLPQGAPIWQATVLLMGAGFFIYGPQALIGITVANQATKDAAAMANGFTGIMGYLSTLVSGIGIAFMKENFGWGAALFAIAATALMGMVILLFAWNAKANGYKNA